MAKLTFTGPTREADAEAARAAAELAGDAAHVHVIPAEQVIYVYTGADVQYIRSKADCQQVAVCTGLRRCWNHGGSAGCRRGAADAQAAAVLEALADH
jgi:hypothetical protein